MLSKRKNKENQKGSALIYSLIILFMLIVIVMSTAFITLIEQKSSIMTRESEGAFEAAETGVNIFFQSVYMNAIRAGDIDQTLGDDPATPEVDGVLMSPNDCSGNSMTANSYQRFPWTAEVTFYNNASGQLGCDDLLSDVDFIRAIGSTGRTTRSVEVSMPYLCLPPFDPDGNTLALWHFEDDGSVISDDSVNGNTGTAYGTEVRNGICFAREFDGNDDYIQFTNNTLDPPSGSITVEVWAKSLSPVWNSNGSMVSKRDAYIMHPNEGTNDISFYVNEDGNDTGWCEVKYEAPAGFDITDWHYYVGTYDSESEDIKIFVDGVQQSPGINCGNLYTGDTGSLFIGRDDGYDDRYFYGLIDEVHISNIARDLTYISSIYSDVVSKFTLN